MIEFVLTPPEVKAPRKNVRKVSRTVYAVLRDTGQLEDKRRAVLRNIAAIYNRRQTWPTCNEVVAWMVERGELPRPSANLISGRITELVKTNVCEFLPLRACRVTARPAHPIRIREIGSVEDPHGYGGRN